MYDIKVIIADAGQAAAHADEIISVIPQYYASQYRRIKKKQEADQELTAGFLLKQYLDVSRDEQLIRTEYGKPMLRSGKPFFNLSHSGEYTMLAIADMDIGVDIEKIREVHWPTVRKVFSKEQRVLLEETSRVEQPRLFTELWTRYEALLKLSGTGFLMPPAPAQTQTPDQEHAKLPGRIVRSFRYKDYMVACSAYEEFKVSIEEAVFENECHKWT